jgi:nitrate reductase delta subunit
MKTLKILATLLDYPQPPLIEALDEIVSELSRESVLDTTALSSLGPLIDTLRTRDLLELQEAYVGLFDRVRSLSLNLFEHVHGESRDRGPALIDLKALYAGHGFDFSHDDLPDYLPAFLEFLSHLPQPEAQAHLADTAHILEALRARLEQRGSPYAAAFSALIALSGARPEPAVVSAGDIRREDDPARLDAEWKEEPAFGCRPKTNEVSVMRFQRGAAA